MTLAAPGVLLCVALAAPMALAQTKGRDMFEENRRREQWLHDLETYHLILDAYIAGDEARSVQVVATPEWDEVRLQALLPRLDGRSDPAAPWSSQRYMAAVLLHTDVALKLAPETQTSESLLHVEISTNLLRKGVRERGVPFRTFAERWFVSVGAHLRSRGGLYGAERLLRTGRDVLRDSAAILYASGTLAELMGTDFAAVTGPGPDVSAFGRIPRTPMSRRWAFSISEVLRWRTGHLNDAEGWLRRAAALDPADDLLRVHLGRVLALRHDDDEAARVLGHVRDTSTDDATVYLANLFIAGLRVRQDKPGDAIPAYRAAIARYDLGQAAYVGLCEVLQRSGKGDEARAVLHSLVTETRGPAKEPLWWYLIDPPEWVDLQLDTLRIEARR